MTSRFPGRYALLALAVLVALLAARPAGALASVTLGTSDLSANTGMGVGCLAPCTFWLEALPSGQAQAPFDGVVVRWRVRLQYLQASGGSGRLRVLSRAGGQVTAVRSGESLPLAQGLNEFADRVPVAAGQTVGFDMPGVNDPDFTTSVNVREAAGAAFGRATPPLSDGAAQPEGSPLANLELLFNAVLEPDADHDGFGDESQDACPTAAGPIGGCPRPSQSTPPQLTPASPPAGSDRTPPQFLGDVGVHPRRLLPGGGAAFVYAVSEPARVTVAIERVLPGRRAGGSCARQTHRNIAKPRCSRFLRVGALGTQAKAGNDRLSWAGRLHGRPLHPGLYRAVFAAVDAAGNVGNDARTTFTVRPLRRRTGSPS